MSRLLTVLSIAAMCGGWGGFVARRSSLAAHARAPESLARPAIAPAHAAASVVAHAAPSVVTPASAAVAAPRDGCEAGAGALVIAFRRGEAELDRRAIDLIELLGAELVPRPDTARRRRARTVRVLASSAAGESETISARALAEARLEAARRALLRAGLWHLQLSEARSAVRADGERGCVRIERAQPASDAGEL